MDEHEIYINQKFYVRWYKMPLIIHDIQFYINERYELCYNRSVACSVNCDQILLGMLTGDVSVVDIYPV